uniref:Putative ixostatin n=1 Tax=Ixodes ricinus TaxID=34613 RepID=A0A0K8R557_IXORI
MMLTLSVVLLATFDYIHATYCSAALASYMNKKCTGLSLKFVKLSDCKFTCEGKNSIDQPQITQLNLADGMPCGSCKQCCHGICTPVQFSSQDPPTPIACAE